MEFSRAYHSKARPHPMPKLPLMAGGVWAKYKLLHRRRPDGMELPQPLTYLELEAFKNATRTWVTPWEADVIMALDDAARAAWATDAAAARKAAESGTDQGPMVSMKDGKGIAGLLRGMANRINSRA